MNVAGEVKGHVRPYQVPALYTWILKSTTGACRWWMHGWTVMDTLDDEKMTTDKRLPVNATRFCCVIYLPFVAPTWMFSFKNKRVVFLFFLVVIASCGTSASYGLQGCFWQVYASLSPGLPNLLPYLPALTAFPTLVLFLLFLIFQLFRFFRLHFPLCTRAVLARIHLQF